MFQLARELPTNKILESFGDHVPRQSTARAEPRTWNLELWNEEPRYTPPVSRTYVRVVLLETIIVIALVIFGRLFS